MKKTITKKTYISTKTLVYATNFKLDKEGKKVVRVLFSGGVRTPLQINGKYSTEDPELQKAMESDPAFNVKYKLHSTSTREVEVSKEVQEPVTDDTDNGGGSDEVDLIDKTFATGAAAKEWLITELEVPASQLPNKPTMVEVAKTKGFNLLFEN